MFIQIAQTGVLAVLWYLWWKWPGRSMVRSSFTGVTVRQRTSSGVAVLAWNVAFFLLLLSVWGVPTWITMPLMILAATAALVVSMWARNPE